MSAAKFSHTFGKEEADMSRIGKMPISIPAGVEVKNELKGWSEFAALTEISTGGYDSASADLTGQKNTSAVILEDVFTGKVSIDTAIADLNKRYNEGVKKYYEENPEKNLNDRIKQSWDTKLN